MKAPFAATTMVYFRKRLTGDVMKEINEMTFAPPQKEKSEDDSQSGESGDDSPSQEEPKEQQMNQGFLLLDATCAPADITYPTDVGLLNESFDVTPFIDRRCKHPVEDIQAAVDGAVSPEQAVKLRKCLNHIDELEVHRAKIESEVFPSRPDILKRWICFVPFRASPPTP